MAQWSRGITLRDLFSRRLVAMGLLLLASLGGTGCNRLETSPEPPRQAILILLEAARWDRFGFAGYPRETTPAMDGLASGGLFGVQHYAQGTSTRDSLPSMMYSRYFATPIFPASDAVPYASPRSLMIGFDGESISLPRALEQDGFRTAAISAHSWIRADTILGREFQQLQDLSAEFDRYSPPARLVVDRARAFIDAHRDEDYFLYLHIMDTHFPHPFGEDARRFFGEGRSYDGPLASGSASAMTAELVPDDEDRRYLDALYDGSLRESDRQIGRLIAHLRSMGRFEDTLIVITSDHGEHLMEVPGRLTHGGPWYDAVARIPLIVSYPGRVEPTRLESFSGLVDIAPTIMALMDSDWPMGKSPDGIDLSSVARGERSGREHATASKGIRTTHYKLLLENGKDLLENADATPRGRLHRVDTDPEERVDLWSERPDVVGDLLARYRNDLTSLHHRFVSAKRQEPLELPFAIAMQHVEVSAPHATLPASASLEDLSRTIQTHDWVRMKQGTESWLLGGETAEGTELSFPLPNGRYEVSLLMRGTAEIALDAEAPKLARGPAFENLAAGAMGFVPLGPVEVEGERLRLRVRPAEDSRLMLGMVGLRPVPRGAERAPEVDPRHVEQLRALGYIR